MQDFKDKKALRTPTPAERMENPGCCQFGSRGSRAGMKDHLISSVCVMVPATGKFEYRDTHFVAMLKLNRVWIVTIAS